MTKLTLMTVAVLCAMPTGYRRAGFALSKGENELQATEEQIQLLADDENLTVVAEAGTDLAQSDVSHHVKSESILQANIELLLAENTSLQSKVDALTKLCEGQEESITLLEIEIANPPTYTHEDTLADLADNSIEINGLNVTTAPGELHLFIALLDDLNQKEPLTKKPNCEHLKMTVDGEDIAPTAAQRDAAWAWYQENVVIASAGSTADVNTDETGE
jgi:hypothetical protein